MWFCTKFKAGSIISIINHWQISNLNPNEKAQDEKNIRLGSAWRKRKKHEQCSKEIKSNKQSMLLLPDTISIRKRFK